jgi:Cytochrome P450
VESARHKPYRRWWGTRRVQVGQALTSSRRRWDRHATLLRWWGLRGYASNRRNRPECRIALLPDYKTRSRAARSQKAPGMDYTRYFPESWDTSSVVVYVVGAASLLVFLVKFLPRLRDPRLASLPPHAPGWPIINQTFVHQQDNPTEILIKWAQKYGELFLTTSGTTTFVWINSRNAFKELIDRKSSIYSSRHPMPMTQDVVSAGKRILFMPYGKEWRTIRQIIHKVQQSFSRELIGQLFTPKMSRSYIPIQHYEAKQLSVNLLDNPDDFYMHNRRYSASVIMQVTYGRRIPVCNPRHYYAAEMQGTVKTFERFTVFSSDSHISVVPGRFSWKCSPPWQIGNSSITLAIGKPSGPTYNKRMSKSMVAFGRV